MYSINGVIKYEAKRNFKSDHRNKWWMTLEVPNFEEVGRYFRWYIDKEWYNIDRVRTNKVLYYRPSHPYHVSIVRGEKPKKNIDDWGKFMMNSKMEIIYDWPIQIISPPSGKGFFWVSRVKLKGYNEIREHFGLPTKTHDGAAYSGHMTVARAFMKDCE